MPDSAAEERLRALQVLRWTPAAHAGLGRAQPAAGVLLQEQGGPERWHQGGEKAAGLCLSAAGRDGLCVQTDRQKQGRLSQPRLADRITTVPRSPS